MSREIEDNLEKLRRIAEEQDIDLLELLKKQNDTAVPQANKQKRQQYNYQHDQKHDTQQTRDHSHKTEQSDTSLVTPTKDSAALSSSRPPQAKVGENTDTVSSVKEKDSHSSSTQDQISRHRVSEPQSSSINDKKHLEKLQEEAWNSVLLARHSSRPNTLYYINEISERYVELHGDRCHGDDSALVGGICTIGGVHFTFIGNQKGTNLKENLQRNYGMAHPEGYRKALRLAKEAERFGRPIVSFIDTSGAFPGIASEERGIGEAIANNIMHFSVLTVPIICIIIGEGGSGGALGIGIGDSICMLENSVYSVISPEGFASILLRDAKKSKEAARLMKMRAQDVLEFGFIDKIIPEPPNGAHTNPSAAAAIVRDSILRDYAELSNKDMATLLKSRSQKIINYTRSVNDDRTNTKKSKILTKLKAFFEG